MLRGGPRSCSVFYMTNANEMTAPFSIETIVHADSVTSHDLPSNDVEIGKCAVCGHGLSVNVIVRDGRGRFFTVGQDCAKSVLKVSSGVMNAAVKRANDKRAMNALRNKLRDFAKSDACRALPHPSTYFKDKTLADYAAYFADRAGVPSTKLSEAIALIETRLAEGARNGVTEAQIDSMYLVACQLARQAATTLNTLVYILVDEVKDNRDTTKIVARIRSTGVEFDHYMEWVRALGENASKLMKRNHANVVEDLIKTSGRGE